MEPDLIRVAATLGLEVYRRHILLCADASEPRCCDAAAGMAAWEFLKRRLKELGLMDAERLVYRSKVGCLRVCTRGPIALVYPEGAWYHSCNPPVLEQIIQEHLIAGRVLNEYCFAIHPL